MCEDLWSETSRQLSSDALSWASSLKRPATLGRPRRRSYDECFFASSTGKRSGSAVSSMRETATKRL
eukprot:10026634-Karenia_brevis.AAC.1